MKITTNYNHNSGAPITVSRAIMYHIISSEIALNSVVLNTPPMTKL